MAGNPFDRFDGPNANPFDRFDDQRMSQGDAFLAAAADSATLGAGDEIAGGIEAARAAISGADAGSAYKRRVAQARENLRRARTDRPGSSLAGSLVGAGATFLVPGVGAIARGGKAIQAAAKAQGMRGLAAQTYLGATRGAGFGAAYGAASGEDGQGVAADAMSRIRSAGSGATFGAAFGAAAPAVLQGAAKTVSGLDRTVTGGAGKKALDAGGRAFADLRARIAGAQPGVQRLRREPPIEGARPIANAADEDIPDAAAREIDKIAGRSGMNADEIERRVGTVRAQAEAAKKEGVTPPGVVLADTLGEEGRATTAAIAQAPGQTGDAAKKIAAERAGTLPDKLLAHLNQGMGVTQTPRLARAEIAAQYRAASKDGYEPALAQEVSEEAMRRLEPVLARFPKKVIEYVDESMEALARIDGTEVGKLTGAQRIHYMKMALDDAISSLQTAEGIGAHQRGALRRLKTDFLRAVEGDEAAGIPAILPKYREARERWGSLGDAEDAMEAGKKAFQQRPDEVRAALEAMTPFEQEHYRVALADAAARKVMMNARAVGETNAANALNSRELQDTLEAAFPDPLQAQKFIDYLNQLNVMMRNASSWRAGSDTMAKSARLADIGLSGMIDGAMHAAGSPQRAAANAALGMMRLRLERERDEIGRALLTALDDGEAETAMYLKALLDKVRQREQGREGRARGAGAQGGLGAIGAPDDGAGPEMM